MPNELGRSVRVRSVMRQMKIILAAMSAVCCMSAAVGDDSSTLGSTRYEQEYPAIHYSGPATKNCIYKLNEKLQRNEVALSYEPRWGYLLSILKALQIDLDSQVLVYSKTSLQTEHIAPQTPRAIYFNDDCYVAWIQSSQLLEFVAMDAQLGVVFYTLDNKPPLPLHFAREGGRCLNCHDTYSMMGGGVPRVLVMSAPVDDPSDPRTVTSASMVDDRTRVSERWGGWYVTGLHGKQTHLGNLPLRDDIGSESLRRRSPQNLRTLAGYFDTKKYPADRSDIAALLVLEHQAYIQSLITRVNFKVRTVLSRAGQDELVMPKRWDDVNPRNQVALRAMIEPLVRALFFADAAPLKDTVKSGSGFAERFSSLAPMGAAGSLRELDLQTRVFRYPLSYMVYSEAFEALPEYARDHVVARVIEVLQGHDTTGVAASTTTLDRKAVLQILKETSPRFAALLALPR
jgi:hypothetical protein